MRTRFQPPPNKLMLSRRGEPRGQPSQSEAGQNILVPVDLQDGSDLVLHYAVDLAAPSDGTVWLLYVVGSSSTVMAEENTPAKFVSALLLELREALEQLKSQTPVPEADVRILIRQGPVAAEIAAAAKEHAADLIVMRNPRRHAWRRLLPFSTVEQVMQLAPCPVLSLRRSFLRRASRRSAPGRAWDRPHLLVPVDFSDSSAKSLRYAAKLADACHARLTLLHVVEAPASGLRVRAFEALPARKSLLHRAKGDLARWVAEQTAEPHEARLLVRLGQTPAETIEGVAERMQPDLLVIGTEKSSWVERMVRGSVVRKLVRRVRSPVLCLNHAATPSR